MPEMPTTGRCPMADLSRPERLQIMLNPEELSALDDWRFAARMPSRAAAVRELLRRGLAVEGIDLGTARKHSASFGVLESTEPSVKSAGGDSAD
jgi:hypothetical protein